MKSVLSFFRITTTPEITFLRTQNSRRITFASGHTFVL